MYISTFYNLINIIAHRLLLIIHKTVYTTSNVEILRVNIRIFNNINKIILILLEKKYVLIN